MSFFIAFRLLVLIGLLCWASYTETREGKVPNLLSITGIVLGLALNLIDGGFVGVGQSLFGMIAGGGPFLALYLIGQAIRKPIMGAGDVKLAAAIGTFVGPLGALYCIFYGLCFEGVLALVIVLGAVLIRKPIPRTIPLGPALALGTVLWVIGSGPLALQLASSHGGLLI